MGSESNCPVHILVPPFTSFVAFNSVGPFVIVSVCQMEIIASVLNKIVCVELLE